MSRKFCIRRCIHLNNDAFAYCSRRLALCTDLLGRYFANDSCSLIACNYIDDGISMLTDSDKFQLAKKAGVWVSIPILS